MILYTGYLFIYQFIFFLGHITTFYFPIPLQLGRTKRNELWVEMICMFYGISVLKTLLSFHVIMQQSLAVPQLPAK